MSRQLVGARRNVIRRILSGSVVSLLLIPTVALSVGTASAETGAMIFPASGSVPNGGMPGDQRPTHTHAGLDISAPTSTQVFAAAGGTVSSIKCESGRGWTIRVAHASGYSTVYQHLKASSWSVTAGASVARGTPLAQVGTTGTTGSGTTLKCVDGAYGAHLHFEILVNGTPNLAWAAEAGLSHGSQVTAGTSINWSFPGLASGGGGSLPSNPLGFPDGTLVKEEGSAPYYVIAGGAKYHIDWAEWQTLGGSSNMPKVVPAGSLASFASVPTRPVFLRDSVSPNPIYQVIGGAKYHLLPAEWQALRSADPGVTAVNVPTGFINKITGTVPADNTMVRDVASPHGIYLVLGGSKYHLQTMAEVNTARSYGAAAHVNVPTAWLDQMTPLQSESPAFVSHPGTDKIFELAGGAKYWLSSAEYADRGRPPSRNIPASLLDRIPTIDPQNALLRDPTSGQRYQIVGRALYALSDGEFGWVAGRPEWSPAVYDVPNGFIAKFNREVPEGSMFLQIPGPPPPECPEGQLCAASMWSPLTTYHVVGESMYEATGSSLIPPTVVRVAPGLLARITRTIPIDGTILRNPASGEVFRMVDDGKRWLTEAEYVAIGRPPWTNVEPWWLETIPTS